MQFPSSGIELRRCDQLGLRRIHLTNVPNACSSSAAVANATTALTKGLSAANQKFVFMLIISSIRRSAFQIGLRIFPASDLAKTDLPVRSYRHETLEVEKRESSVDCTLDSHGDRRDRSRDRRAVGADARGLLGGNRDS